MHKSRSIRRSGHPTVASAASRLRAFDRDPICEEHYGQRPAKSAASTGRTDGSTDQHCITVQKSLANREPSTDGYKRTCGGAWKKVRFTPESGHSEAPERVGLKKRTLDVCLTPDSGRRWVGRWMSAYDPKRTLLQFSACSPSTSHSAGLRSHSATMRSASVIWSGVMFRDITSSSLDAVPPFLSDAS